MSRHFYTSLCWFSLALGFSLARGGRDVQAGRRIGSFPSRLRGGQRKKLNMKAPAIDMILGDSSDWDFDLSDKDAGFSNTEEWINASLASYEFENLISQFNGSDLPEDEDISSRARAITRDKKKQDRFLRELQQNIKRFRSLCKDSGTLTVANTLDSMRLGAMKESKRKPMGEKEHSASTMKAREREEPERQQRKKSTSSSSSSPSSSTRPKKGEGAKEAQQRQLPLRHKERSSFLRHAIPLPSANTTRIGGRGVEKEKEEEEEEEEDAVERTLVLDFDNLEIPSVDVKPSSPPPLAAPSGERLRWRRNPAKAAPPPLHQPKAVREMENAAMPSEVESERLESMFMQRKTEEPKKASRKRQFGSGQHQVENEMTGRQEGSPGGEAFTSHDVKCGEHEKEGDQDNGEISNRERRNSSHHHHHHHLLQQQQNKKHIPHYRRQLLNVKDALSLMREYTMSHATEAANIDLDDRIKKEADSWVIEKEITQSELHEAQVRGRDPLNLSAKERQKIPGYKENQNLIDAIEEEDTNQVYDHHQPPESPPFVTKDLRRLSKLEDDQLPEFVVSGGFARKDNDAWDSHSHSEENPEGQGGRIYPITEREKDGEGGTDEGKPKPPHLHDRNKTSTYDWIYEPQPKKEKINVIAREEDEDGVGSYTIVGTPDPEAWSSQDSDDDAHTHARRGRRGGKEGGEEECDDEYDEMFLPNSLRRDVIREEERRQRLRAAGATPPPSPTEAERNMADRLLRGEGELELLKADKEVIRSGLQQMQVEGNHNETNKRNHHSEELLANEVQHRHQQQQQLEREEDLDDRLEEEEGAGTFVAPEKATRRPFGRRGDGWSIMGDVDDLDNQQAERSGREMEGPRRSSNNSLFALKSWRRKERPSPFSSPLPHRPPGLSPQPTAAATMRPTPTPSPATLYSNRNVRIGQTSIVGDSVEELQRKIAARKERMKMKTMDSRNTAEKTQNSVNHRGERTALASGKRPINIDEQELVPLDSSTSTTNSSCSSTMMKILKNKYVHFHENRAASSDRDIKTSDLDAGDDGKEVKYGEARQEDLGIRRGDKPQHPEANEDQCNDSDDEDYEPQVLPPLLRGKGAKEDSDRYGGAPSMKPEGQILRARALEARHARWKQQQRQAEEEKRERREVREVVVVVIMVCKDDCNDNMQKNTLGDTWMDDEEKAERRGYELLPKRSWEDDPRLRRSHGYVLNLMKMERARLVAKEQEDDEKN
eukprot:jgi/Bigna1/68881/fgenesh1_pg.7_\